jgi:hypothetical protein
VAGKAKPGRKRGHRPPVPPPADAAPPSAWPRARIALVAVAAAYLTTVWFDGIGSGWPSSLLPRPWLYFGQIAALFKYAGIKSIDYRAEGWVCAERRWVEIDVRPFFRIDRDNKENRFHRALQFYRRERLVMRSLDDYVTSQHNAVEGRPAIGGVRFSSLRLDYPAPGERISRYERKPLASHSAAEKKSWYWSPKSRRTARCGEPAEPGSAATSDDDASPSAHDAQEKAQDRDGEP